MKLNLNQFNTSQIDQQSFNEFQNVLQQLIKNNNEATLLDQTKFQGASRKILNLMDQQPEFNLKLLHSTPQSFIVAHQTSHFELDCGWSQNQLKNLAQNLMQFVA